MRKRAQSINEYVLVIALVTLAGIGMQIYIKRGIQGIVKTSADRLAGEKGDSVVYTGSAKSILPRAQWNPVAIAYADNKLNGGFFVAEVTGNQVYYNLYSDSSNLNNKTVIGGQDLASGDFTSYDWEGYVDAVYDKNGNLIQSFTPKQARADYAPYEILSLNTAANKSMVQSGVMELGLVAFDQKDHPLKFTADKKVIVHTVSKHSISPQNLAAANWHPAMTAYQVKMVQNNIPGFIQAEVQGNMVYYYTFTTDIKNKILFGGENLHTGDFTQFGPDGFPISTVDSNLTVLRTYSGYVTDPVTKEITGIIGSDGNIYGQNQIVTISPVLPTTGPATVASPMTTKTIDHDTTHVTGAWTAVYKLENANTFGARDKTGLNNNNLNAGNNVTGHQ
ncbi:MAG: hypothetical protein PHG87_07215 [Candidatus Omnitrophica bacterium]|nr:hypothetical protein [Candidatus Omnitrophota bacterium]